MAAPSRSMALARGMLVAGDQWNLLIVQAAFERVRRYGTFRARLGVSDAVLTGRLADLVADEVLMLHTVDGEQAGEYVLTERGRGLWSIFVAAWRWAVQWDPTTAAKAVLVHDRCSAASTPELGCATCGKHEIPYSELRVLGSPGATLDAANPPRRYRRATVVDEGSTRLPPELVRLLGDRWSVSVLVAALLGARRFSDFEAIVTTGPNVISDRLRGFVDAGVFRSERIGSTRRSDYHVAPKGLDLVPFLVFVNDWSQRWYGDPDQPEVTVEHGDHRLAPTWVCDHCGERLERAEVHFASPESPQS